MKLAKQNHPFGNTSLMNWFFDDVLTQNAFNKGQTGLHSAHLSRPKTNILKTSEGYALEVAAPGFTKEDFKIDIEKNRLSVSVEKTTKEHTSVKNYKSREFNFSSFKRAFTLPEHTDVEHITAEYDNGILALNLPLKKGAKKTLQIAVK
ncbi:MAG: Hsp20/alpha crystallin family protein [Flavobacteriales bacterium]